MCRAFYDRYNLDYVGLRYMNVYGPHQDQTAAYTGVVPIMLNKIDANEPPVINGDGTQAYDFIYVEDVARSNVLALKAVSTDEFYNVGSGVQTSIKARMMLVVWFRIVLDVLLKRLETLILIIHIAFEKAFYN